jgi:hypothetical protein
VISRSRVLAALCASACLALALASPASALTPKVKWAPLAVSGPTNLPPLQSETQTLGVKAEGGNFTLSFHPAAARGRGDLHSFSTTVANVITSSGAFAAGQDIEGAGIPPGTTITACSPSCAAPTSLTLSKATGPGNFIGTSLVSTSATATTAPIDFDAEASEVEDALNALIAGEGGSVIVGGGPGDAGATHPYRITFEGSLANLDVAQLSADGTGLSGAFHGASVLTPVPGGEGTATLAVYAQNVGGIASSGTITVKGSLPAGMIATAGRAVGGIRGDAWSCTPGAGQSSFECTSTAGAGAPPGDSFDPVRVPVIVDPAAPSTGTAHFEVSGGGADEPPASFDLPLTVSAIPALPGMQAFLAGAYDEEGNLDTRAGGHPYSASAAIFANTVRSPLGIVVPAGEFKNVAALLPPGFLGNPIAVPQCPESVLDPPVGPGCPPEMVLGTVQPALQFGEVGVGFTEADAAGAVFLKNIQAPFGYPAKFKFKILNEALNVVGSVRSDEDYGVTAASPNTPQIESLFGFFFTFWGTPASSSHDAQRPGGALPAGTPETAFLTQAVNCSEEAVNSPTTLLTFNTWQHPTLFSEGTVTAPPVTGCENLEFKAATPGHPGVGFTFEPSDTKSDSPASFRTELTVPEEGLTNPAKLTMPEIKTSVVQLPKGVVLNASAADGLGSCSEQQIGLKNEIDPATGLPKQLAMPNPIRFSKDPNQCPDSSKIGTGELKSALLENPLHGALYLAAQGKGNPFGSLFALYLVIEDPQTGIFIKLPGEVEVDEQTGQMAVRFQNLPQLPFTYLRLNLKGGNRSPLASPTTCGNYVTTATNTPWSAPESGPPAESSNGFEITQGPNGMPCAKTPQERPFDIGWKAGANSTQAGASGPFSFQITRPDGSQELESLQLDTPPGVSASLKGIPYCTQAEIKAAELRTGAQELANPACPAASQVGTLQTAAGSGPTPFYVNGKAYLAGPYKGAPISVVAVTPALAGPFDLGNVVVRSAVFIDRTTAQVSAQTDPIPQFLKGVALRIRDVRIFLNHKDWTINPTSCNPMTVDLAAHGNSGAVAHRSTHFQVGNCRALRFKPTFKAHLAGGTQRSDHPAFTAKLTYPKGPGYANVKDVQVTLPHSEFLDQAHIRTICTRVQAAAHACPRGSIYGFAEAETPLLDGKLTGPVFLKSSDHKLPDLAIALRGPDNQPVEVEFAGRIDSVHGQIRNTIEGLPDVPVSKFVLKMKGGRKGLLVNSRNLCQGKPGRITVDMTAQNNRTAHSKPKLGNSCGKAKKHKKARKHHRRRLGALVAGW